MVRSASGQVGQAQPTTPSLSEIQKITKSPKVVFKGGLRPMASARDLQSITNHDAKSQIKQVMDLCIIVDKDRTGKIQIPNFMRIAQASGLRVDNKDLMMFTNERENKVEYGKLVRELNSKLSGLDSNIAIREELGYKNDRAASPF